MKLACVVKTEDEFRLFGKEFFCFNEESEDRVAIKEGFEVRDSSRFGLDGTGSGGLGLFALFPELFGDFGDEK